MSPISYRVNRDRIIMDLRTPVDIGAAIRDRRRKLRLGQDELAARVGVSRKWVIDVEKGKAGAEIGLVLRTMDALGLRLSLDGPAGSRGGRPAISVVDIDQIIDDAHARRT